MLKAPPDTKSAAGFESLGLRPEILATLADLGYEEPTPVQRAAIPVLLEGRDTVAQAATGTGKTAAFALPILQRLRPGAAAAHATSALVVVPTRELAMQVAEAVHGYGRRLGVSVLPVYGGQPMNQQLRRLKRGVDVVIATPGRALDHVRRKTLRLGSVQAVVLDEADEMLDLGFAEELDALLAELPKTRQTALFSATLPPRILSIAERHLRNPVRLRVADEGARQGVLPRVRQTAYIVPRAHKEAALGRILDVEGPRSALVFCRTRLQVERLTDVLVGHGYEAAALHGGLTQDQRERVLKQFKAHRLALVVATDVAARGLDVQKLSHVINYDLPTSAEDYVHRIGRTGRAGREGVAVTLLEPREHRLLRNIERLAGRIEVAKLPTLVDLRARQLELTRATVAEAVTSGRFEPYRAVVNELSSETELLDVAAAAVAALHEALNPDRDGVEIPAGAPPAGERPRAPRERPGARERPARAEPRGRGERPARGERSRGGQTAGTRLFVGLGRSAGLRPADLVGAIANEAGLDRSEIGTIQIEDHHAFVEVADARADEVVEVLRRSTLRGRKVKIDRDRPAPRRKRGAPPAPGSTRTR